MINVHDVSIVIPSRSGEDHLQGLLSGIRSWRAQPREIIVIEGPSNRQTRSLCSMYDAQWYSGPECRGTQLCIGASYASGVVLWFLHADARPDARSLQAIVKSVAAGSIGGYFRFRLSGPRRWFKPAFETLVRWRGQIGTPYGDQGIFVTTDAYENNGGFDPQPLFEEVRLIRRLRRRRRFSALTVPLEVSSRRWETHGWMLVSLQNRLFAFAHILGASPERLANLYWRPRAAGGLKTVGPSSRKPVRGS